MFQPVPALYGRETELGVIRACLRAAREGRGQLVLIAGEAGIGKSSLIQAATTDLPSDAVVLRGSSFDLGATPPYGTWLDLLQSYEPDAGLPDLPAIVRNLDAFESIGGGQALFEDVATFFVDVASRRLLVLVIEDAQWSDHASIELLRFLARRLLTLPVLLIVTYRDDELVLGDPLYLYLPQIVRETNATRIVLRPLRESDIRELVDARYQFLDADAAQMTTWLARLGEGNPFFITELLQALEHDGVVCDDNGTWTLGNLDAVQVPSLILQLVDARFERLDPSARNLLQIAAVIGIEAPIDLWAEASGASDDDLADAISQAQSARLIVEIRGRPSFEFQHALVRESLYYSIVLPRRRALHGQVAAAIARQPAPDPDSLSHHLYHARDPQAAAWLTRAGVRAAKQFAWRTAVSRFRVALESLGQAEHHQTDSAWLLFFIGMLSRRFALDESIRALDQSLALAEHAEDQLLIGIITSNRGLLHCIAGRVAEGLKGIESGIAAIDRTGLPETSGDTESIPSILRTLIPDLGSRRGMYVNWLAMAGYFDEALRQGEACVPRIPDTPPQTGTDDYYDAYIGLGQAYAAFNRPDDARAAFDKALAGYSSIEPMPWVFFRAEAFCLATFWLDQPERREKLWSLVGESWRRIGGVHTYTPRRDYRLEMLYYLRGDWNDAVDSANMIIERGAAGVGSMMARVVLGFVYLHRGQADLAWDQHRLIRVEHNIDTFGDAWFHGAIAAHGLEASLALAEGQLGRADAAIERQRAWLDWSGARSGRAELDLFRASRARKGGDVQAAETHARSALDRSTSPRQPLTLMRANRLLGELALERGHLEDAREHIDASIALGYACDTPFDLALGHIVSAGLDIGLGRLDEARAALTIARDVCERLRAKPALDRIGELEAELDAPPRVHRVPGGLSDREMDVLRLVAQGLSDAEVAERLFISRRTVGGHLQSIYNKLGVTSRTAAVAFAFENRLV